MDLENKIDKMVNSFISFSEHDNELLFGDCHSGFELTNTQEHILMLLLNGELTNSELASQLNISQAAVTKAVKSLLANDFLIAKKSKIDGRIIRYSLTKKADSVAQEHYEHHSRTLEVYSKILHEFDKSEQEVIERFVDMLEREVKF